MKQSEILTRILSSEDSWPQNPHDDALEKWKEMKALDLEEVIRKSKLSHFDVESDQLEIKESDGNVEIDIYGYRCGDYSIKAIGQHKKGTNVLHGVVRIVTEYGDIIEGMAQDGAITGFGRSIQSKGLHYHTGWFKDGCRKYTEEEYAPQEFVVVVVCPQDSPALKPMTSFTDGVSFFIANTLEEFEAQPEKLASAKALMFFATGGDVKLMPLLIDRCPNVLWCHSFFAGVDALAPFIKEKLLGRSDIPLTNGKGAFSDSLAEYVMAASLHFNKRVTQCLRNREEKKWDKFVMPVLSGKTMGFVGFGHIGQTTARFARAFGMHVLALRRNPGSGCAVTPENPHGVDVADETLGLDQKLELFRRSDVVVSVLPGTPDTINFCGAAEFAAMKSDAIFVSVGRGTVVDEDALANALKTKAIAGAALDVFKVEPLPAESPLWGCENLLLTAHNADYTENYFELGWSVWRANFDALQSGAKLATPVNKDQGY